MRQQIIERLRANPIPIQLPIGGGERPFEGVVDLVNMRSIRWSEDNMGSVFNFGDIPAELQEEADHWRKHLLEAVAETDESVMEEYLENDTLPAETIIAGLRQLTIANEAVPMLCGTCV